MEFVARDSKWDSKWDRMGEEEGVCLHLVKAHSKSRGGISTMRVNCLSQLKEAKGISEIWLRAEFLTLRIWVCARGRDSARADPPAGTFSVYNGQGSVKMVGSMLSRYFSCSRGHLALGYLAFLFPYGHLASGASWTLINREMVGRMDVSAQYKGGQRKSIHCVQLSIIWHPQNTHAHTHSHAHTLIHIHTLTYLHTYTHSHVHIVTYTLIHMHTYTHSHVLTCLHTYTHSRTFLRPFLLTASTGLRIQASGTHACQHTRAHACVYACIRVHSCVHAFSCLPCC